METTTDTPEAVAARKAAREHENANCPVMQIAERLSRVLWSERNAPAAFARPVFQARRLSLEAELQWAWPSSDAGLHLQLMMALAALEAGNNHAARRLLAMALMKTSDVLADDWYHNLLERYEPDLISAMLDAYNTGAEDYVPRRGEPGWVEPEVSA